MHVLGFMTVQSLRMHKQHASPDYAFAPSGLPVFLLQFENQFGVARREQSGVRGCVACYTS